MVDAGFDTANDIRGHRTHQQQLIDECSAMRATNHEINLKVIQMQQECSATVTRWQIEKDHSKILMGKLTKRHADDMMRLGMTTANTQCDELSTELKAACTHSALVESDLQGAKFAVEQYLLTQGQVSPDFRLSQKPEDAICQE